MTPNQLKNSILQLAIQGKLTEEFRAQSEEHREDPFSQPNGCQLPQQQSFGGASSLAPTRSAPKKLGEVSRSDERGLIDLSAEELLKQIQAEKAELIKQGNNKREKEIRDERKENCLPNRVFCHNRHCEPAESWRGNLDLLYADAETLLKTISEEKEALIKQGKIKKDKNESTIIKRGNSYFEKVGTTEKCIDDELPFEIPDSWRWARLRNIVYNRPQKKPDKEFCYIDIGSIDNKKQCLSDNENIIKPENAPSRARKIISKGDIIYSTVRPYLHNMAIIDKDFSHEPIASTGFATMVSLINNKYLFNYLLSPEFDNYANSTDNSKGVAYPAINDEKLYKALIAIPPLAEQHRIVAKIEELLPMVEKYGEAYNKLETLNKSFPTEIKKSILQYAIQGKLTESWRLSVNEELGVRNEELKKMLPKFNCGSCHEDAAPRMVGKLASDSSTEGAAMRSIAVEGAAHEVSGESAEELLAHIQAEKEALIKQGKIKKDKNESTIIKRGNSYFEKVGTTEKCIDDELPFEIPDTWLWVKLDELAIKEIRRGKSPKYAEKGSAYAFAQKCNSKYEGIKLDLALYLDDSSLKRYSEEEAIIDKDIIINSTGTGTLGRIGFYKESYNVLKAKYYPDSHVTVLRVSKNILPEFVFACLKYHNPWLEKQGEGSTNQKELKPHTIKNLPIPLPPLAEQHRIVAKIEELFAFVDKLQK